MRSVANALESMSCMTRSTRLFALSWMAAALFVTALFTLYGVAAPVVVAVLAVILLLRFASLFEVPMAQPNIVVTELDAQRLSNLLEGLSPRQRDAACALELELERAQVVSSRGVPGDVVTMNSRVVFEEIHSGLRAEVRLVYPSEAARSEDGAISVLAPVGSALLGMRVGQAIDWRMPNGRLRRYQVVDVIYQPEAAGDLDL